MKASLKASAAMRVLPYALAGLGFTGVVVIAMLWLIGVFYAKIDTEQAAGPPVRSAHGAQVEPVRVIRVPVYETAVGSVRPVHETAVASKLLAKVTAVHVKAGQAVNTGDVLIELDSNDLQARVQQASAAVDAARAVRDQAKIENDRVEKLLEQNSATQIERDRAGNALKAAAAELDRAGQTLTEAKTVLEYATIRASLTGIVVDKKVDVGDTAAPGQTLLTLYDPTRMQLVASVRESLSHRLRVEQMIGVEVEALNLKCEGRISEIVPESESASRTFSVKVTGPCPPGVHAGMFGRLVIPLDDEAVVVVPATTIRRVGQLTVVDVIEGEGLRRRAVQLGRTFGESVEVLSGLREGERVAVPSAGEQVS